MARSQHLALLAVLGALGGCSGKWKTDSDDTSDGGGTSSNGDVDLPDGIDDPTAGLDEGGCEDFQGTPIAGAASYFWGIYVLTDEETGTWSGTEQWLLFANDAWEDVGGYDCEITWIMAAESTSAVSCAVCDLGLSVAGTLDQSRSDCPEGLWEGSENWTEQYDVLRTADGRTTFYFAESGDQIGTGEYTDEAMSFLSEKACDWF